MWNTNKLRNLWTFILLIIFSFTATISRAQYFGRNKVNYTKFDFKVLQTPDFEIYHYLKNEKVKNRFAQQCEQWYKMHQAVLKDTFKERNPVIIYNNHAHFQQTRAIEGSIGVGTGGVTEALKNRVIMPFMETNSQTDHVLGHELVHAFQYHLIQDTLSLNALNNLPLWMVEGLAEYMSIGYVDAHTALWLRSAVANIKLPSLKDLTNRPDLYFPYRWGQAFWAYTTGIYGDAIIPRLFIETGRSGYDQAIKNLFKIDEKEFSNRWKEAIRSAYSPLMAKTQSAPSGKNLINKKNAGDLNIVPSLSPDGKWVAFWTEKNLFSLDLYIADALTGRIVDKVTSNKFNSHIDEYSSFESSVAWSPDSREVAFVAFSKGRNRLVISSTGGKIRETFDIPGVEGFSNPTWSPDGNTIVVTGLVDGQSDLYAFDLNTKSVKQLTNDTYSDIQPSYSPDGKWIVFSTDRLSMDEKRRVHQFSHNIALYNVETSAITNLEFFKGANNLNPVFASDNSVIYFLSDRDGFRNLYTYDIRTRELSERSRFFSGITGITMYAPAISASRQTDRVAYTYYNNGDYTIYGATSAELPKTPVNSNELSSVAATLPPLGRNKNDIVQNNLMQANLPVLPISEIKEVPFKPKFQLDYIGSTGVGLSTGGAFGTGLAGGVNGIFSDILGNNQLFGAVALNGEIYDVGAQFAYLNQSKRINWGMGLSHVPYLSGAEYLFLDTVVNRSGDSVQVLNYSLDLLRTFEDQLQVFASYPFSTIRRFEAGASFARYYYRLDRYSDYYDPSGQFYLGNDKQRQETPSGFNFGQGYVALVGDNSFFGVAAPLDGHRFRFEAGQYVGVVNLQNLSADYRRYFRFAPVTLATRNMFVGRYGRDAETGVLPPLYVGYPSLVRGYQALDYANGNGQPQITINDLIGSKMFITNAELRLPLSGPERLGIIKSRFFLADLNLFTDGGLAWGNAFTPGSGTGIKNGFVARDQKFILSSGLSLRVNLFGYLVLEPYYAIPWQNGGFKNASFGLNFLPGW
jgi:Tol biopolymer transport system component